MVRGDDRGQLILVGAIAIALVLLGLVLVVDTALFTQVVGSEGTVETARGGGIGAEELGDSIGDVVDEENRRGADPAVSDSPADIDNRVESQVRDQFRPAFVNRSLESSGSFVDVEYIGRTEVGTRVTQDSIRRFTNSSLVGSWHPVPPSNRGDVGGFYVTIYTNESDFSSGLDVTVEGQSGGSRTLQLLHHPTEDRITLDVAGGATCSDINATEDTVRIDVSDGRVFEDPDCTFDLFGPLEPGYSIQFTSLGDIRGTYSFVTDSSLSSSPHYNSPSDPRISDAVWSFEYEYTYDTDDVTVESERREVDVYG